jgi:hypothetical protein
VHELGFQFPQNVPDPHNPFVENRVRFITPLLTAIYLMSTCALGAPIVRMIRGSEEWPAVVRVLGGFLPGFLIPLVPLQVLFAATDLVTAARIALVAVPVAALLVHRRTLAASMARARDGARPDAGRVLAVLGGLVLILALCAVHRMQAGRSFMVPDSILSFLQAGDVQVTAAWKYLLQWDQQTDEWVFNAPLLFNSRAGRDQMLVFWCTQFVALASFAALAFGLIRTFARRHRNLTAGLALGLVLASTPAIFPWYNIAIVGGQNPALLSAHPGRQIALVAPWITLLLLGQRRTRLTTALLLLAVAGLAFTTIHGAMFVVAALVCAGGYRVLRARRPVTSQIGGRIAAAAVHGLAFSALAAPVYVYYAIHETVSPDGLGWYLVAAIGAAVTAAVVAAVAFRPADAAPDRGAPLDRGAWRRPVAFGAACVTAFAVGLFLSNNLVSRFAGGAVRDALSHVLPGYGFPVASRNVMPQNLTFPTFTGDECTYSGHCLSFGYFLAAYGLTIVVALATWVALRRVGADEVTERRRSVWLIAVGALAAGFAIVDFTGANLTGSWVLTRFIEVPYYTILVLAAIVFVGSRNRVTAVVGTAVLMIWTVVPFVHSHYAEQWVKNAGWLAERLH